MIRYLKHSEIDKKLWDESVSSSVNGIIYAYSWYLDIICDGWDAVVNDDYSIIMPVTKGRKYLMSYIYPPYFSQQLGVFSKYPLTENDFINFINTIPAEFKFIEMNLHVSNQWTPSGFTFTRNSDYILDLSKSYQEVRKNYSENHSRNCTKASRNGLTLFRDANTKTVIEMFRANRGKDITKLRDHHYNQFSHLVEEAGKRNMARVWSVSNPDGIPCAAAVFFESHNSAIFIFSAISSTGRNLSAMHFLIDQYIAEFSGKKAVLDFEGSNDADLARFYKGFGSKEFVYLQIKKNDLPAPWSWVKK